MNEQSSFFEGRSKAALEALLPDYLRALRWFSAKARSIARVVIAGEVPFSAKPDEPPSAYITFIKVIYAEGDGQTFVLPLSLATGEDAKHVSANMRKAVVANMNIEGAGSGVLYDATWDPRFAQALLESIGVDRRFGNAGNMIHAWPTEVYAPMAAGATALNPRIVGAEQSNTSIIYGQDFILKLFRRLEQGVSPDLEIGRFLTEKGFAHTPPLAGALEREVEDGEPVTLAILQGFVPNRGDAWSYTLEELDTYFRSIDANATPVKPTANHPLDAAEEELTPAVAATLGAYLDSARLLGRRTAEMHLALASDSSNPAFAPEPFTMQDQRHLLAAVQQLSANAFKLLKGRLSALPDATRAEAEGLISRADELTARLSSLSERELAAMRTRCHGDYHLGQILYTSADFVLIDFEGEPLRSLEERRQKHSPLKDVAGMLRSFHYAAYAALFNQPAGSITALTTWADAWHGWISAAFLKEYLEVAAPGNFLPASRDDLRALLDAYLLEKAIYELIYELNNRPDWVRIPLQGIIQLTQ